MINNTAGKRTKWAKFITIYNVFFISVIRVGYAFPFKTTLFKQHDTRKEKVHRYTKKNVSRTSSVLIHPIMMLYKEGFLY